MIIKSSVIVKSDIIKILLEYAKKRCSRKAISIQLLISAMKISYSTVCLRIFYSELLCDIFFNTELMAAFIDFDFCKLFHNVHNHYFIANDTEFVLF